MINSQDPQSILYTTIAQRRSALYDSAFINFVADTSKDTSARISYVPHMLFFIMGFKDMLQELQQQKADDHIQQHVNEHCQEDNGHWKWFLQDIKNMDMPGNFFRNSPSHVCLLVWADEHMPIRRMVYKAMSYCYQCQTPAQRMIILEVIEAIFSVFVENMNILIKQMDKYETYLFFGRVHHEAEGGHSNGSWLDGGKKEIEVERAMSQEEKTGALSMIHGLFDCWEEMASHYHFIQQSALKTPASKL